MRFDFDRPNLLAELVVQKEGRGAVPVRVMAANRARLVYVLKGRRSRHD